MVSVRRTVEVEDQVKALMADALDDREGGVSGGRASAGALRDLADGKRGRQPLDPINIRDLIVPGLGNRRIFRILLTNACRYSCDYCPMRAERDLPRHALEPARLARLFMTAFRRGWCDGLFITSGIPKDAVWAMDRMLELVELLRVTHGYRGYLHVKALAGAEPGQVEKLVRLVDRVSYNLEAPCQQALSEHAPGKELDRGLEILTVARDAAETVREARRASARKAPPALPPARVPGGMGAGATTQFVVGLGRETDRELLSFAEGLEKKKLIHHAQFAAFRPIASTPLEGRPETPALRERRLYEADHLLRQYGFQADELPYGEDGHLPLDQDPKLAWAVRHPERFPVELTTASREDLQRVPGFGPRAVERILVLRGTSALRDLGDLRRLGVRAGRAAGYVTLRGKALGTRVFQSALFSMATPSPQKAYDFSPGTFR
jgi:predicted DNA-binding helix-hairpin-helix protein